MATVVEKKMPDKSCEDCGSLRVMHMGTRKRCCRCHVLSGNLPSDWHRECMSTFEEMNKTTEKPAGEGGPGG